MTRNEIVEKIATSLEARIGKTVYGLVFSKELLRQMVRASVVAAFDVISDTLEQGEPVTILNFGRFDVQLHRARMGNTIQDGVAVPVEIPERRVVRFRPSQRLKERMEVNMEKLGVQVDEGKTKTAQKDGQDKCGCGRELDKTANVPKCPVHGTEPFEPDKRKGK